MKTPPIQPSKLRNGLSVACMLVVWLAVSVAVMGQDQAVVIRKNCLHLESVVVQSSDEVWLISARQSHLSVCDLSLLHCCRLENCEWVESELSELVERHSADKSLTTMIFAHGNRTNFSWAKSRGLQFYRSVFGGAPCERPPVRFVIFAWKSEAEIVRPRADFKIKSRRSFELGQLFSHFLNQFEDKNILIGGYSLGGQVVLSGLSKTNCETNCETNEERSSGQYQVALLAPVFHSNFSGAPLCNYSVNPFVDQTVVFVSRKDKVVKIGGRIERRNDRRSGTTMSHLADMGCSGVYGIRICDVTREVGCKHSVVNYASSSKVKWELLELLSRVYVVSNQEASDGLLTTETETPNGNTDPESSHATVGVSAE